MNWFACELHTHTVHSDGSHTLPELAAGADRLGFDAIALTDHNTMSALSDKEAVERETGVLIIPGMEWTTSYGHMVTIGLKAFVDWREAQPHNIRQGVAAVHRHGGAAGIAHPFRIGSPACTGCFWEYEIPDWNEFDYIEVWSGTFAPVKTDNQRAFALWADKLNEGVKIAAASGRDWHVQTETDEPVSVTYLGLADGTEPTADSLVQALRNGRAVVTIGPLIELAIALAGESYGIGSIAPLSRGTEGRVRVRLDFSVRPGLWTLSGRTFRLLIQSNLGLAAEREVDRSNSMYDMEIFCGGLKWVRAELWGAVRGVNTMIAFTNAVYFER